MGAGARKVGDRWVGGRRDARLRVCSACGGSSSANSSSAWSSSSMTRNRASASQNGPVPRAVAGGARPTSTPRAPPRAPPRALLDPRFPLFDPISPATRVLPSRMPGGAGSTVTPSHSVAGVLPTEPPLPRLLPLDPGRPMCTRSAYWPMAGAATSHRSSAHCSICRFSPASSMRGSIASPAPAPAPVAVPAPAPAPMPAALEGEDVCATSLFGMLCRPVAPSLLHTPQQHVRCRGGGAVPAHAHARTRT